MPLSVARCIPRDNFPSSTRRARRARATQTRSKNRKEARHWCALDADAQKRGIHEAVGLSLAEFHAIHRALGERECPRCPHCNAKKPVDLTRAQALNAWGQHMAAKLKEIGARPAEQARDQRADAELAEQLERSSWKPGPDDIEAPAQAKVEA